MDIKELAPALAHRTCNRYKHGDEISHKALDERDHYLRELQASQAREAKLLEALELAMPAIGYGYDAARCTAAFETVHTAQAAAVQALALPTDDSALMERLKEERERVALWLIKCGHPKPAIDAIRGLV